MPRLARPLLALALLLPATLPAHPDPNATQQGIVEPVPSTQKPTIESSATITMEGDKRVIVSNGIPDHATGRFPNQDKPNRIAAQRQRFTVPLKPVRAERAVAVGHTLFGVALNGVVFDPATAEAWQNDRDSGWHYDALGQAFSLGLDTNHGHVQPGGVYHYHGIPVALLERLSAGQARPTLVGWAADGFPVYAKWDFRDPKDNASPAVALRTSYRLKKGRRPTSDGQPGGAYDGVFVEDFEYVAGSGDLDECGGRFGVTPEYPSGTYHYVLTEDFPFIPRFFRGAPDPSFSHRGGPRGPRPGEGPDRGDRPEPPSPPPFR